jgi:hypothetical protein
MAPIVRWEDDEERTPLMAVVGIVRGVVLGIAAWAVVLTILYYAIEAMSK